MELKGRGADWLQCALVAVHRAKTPQIDLNGKEWRRNNAIIIPTYDCCAAEHKRLLCSYSNRARGLRLRPPKLTVTLMQRSPVSNGQTPKAKELGTATKGILVFPKIIKAGLLVGAQAGEGALRVKGKTAGYYNTVAASYGLQVGVQWFGYAMFFRTDKALGYLGCHLGNVGIMCSSVYNWK